MITANRSSGQRRQLPRAFFLILAALIAAPACGGPENNHDLDASSDGDASMSDAPRSDVPRADAHGIDVVIPGDCTPVPETCNNTDDNCNGQIDEGLSQNCYTGPAGTVNVGQCRAGMQSCTSGVYGACAGQVTPATEICNGLDDDCNGQTDENLGTRVCGTGSCAQTIQTCVNGVPRDCSSAGNGTPETCNNVDDNCNGLIDEGLSQNCYTGPAGTANVGRCRAGMQSCISGVYGACMGEVTPATEICNGIDDDCNGQTDENLGTTLCGAGSCAQTIQNCVNGVPQSCASAGNGTPESCNNVDDNCNGVTDEGLSQNCYTGPSGTANVGRCRAGTQSCIGGVYGACAGQVTPATEICNGIDDDCNGQTDENLGTRTCGTGACAQTIQTCLGGVPQTCPTSGGTPETCNGIDDNCNGTTDEGLTQSCYSGPSGTVNVGRCRAGTSTCTAGTYGTCTGEVTPSTGEICTNGVDDDCNGQTDEGCTAAPFLTCPAAVTVGVNTPASLTATTTSTGTPVFTWTVTASPTGSAVTWTPSPPTRGTEAFTGNTAGTYTIHVTAMGTNPGESGACDTQVTVVPSALRVTLTWDGTGDLDLHLHNGRNTPWFGMADDCYYANRNAMWDSASVADNGVLDFDNTNANGPEQSHIDAPVIGENYTIGVHNYTRGLGRIATVNVYCGGSATPAATLTSRALAGASSGNCSSNDFWKAATVTFSSPTACTVTMMNLYTTSSYVCSGF